MLSKKSGINEKSRIQNPQTNQNSLSEGCQDSTLQLPYEKFSENPDKKQGEKQKLSMLPDTFIDRYNPLQRRQKPKHCTMHYRCCGTCKQKSTCIPEQCFAKYVLLVCGTGEDAFCISAGIAGFFMWLNHMHRGSSCENLNLDSGYSCFRI